MTQIRIKKGLCLVLVIALFFSLSAGAYADDGSDSSSCIGGLIRNALTKYAQNHNNLLSREIIRAQFRTAAAAGAAVGGVTAATLLNRSLQNHPADLICDSCSGFALQIRLSSEFREIMNIFKKNAGDLTQYSMTGAIALRSTPDLYLSYNAVRYEATGTRSGQVWNITVTFFDTYDFSMMAWSQKLSDLPAVIALNNYAAYAQNVGAIVPYNIRITVKASVRV